jgi:hypothetical protein
VVPFSIVVQIPTKANANPVAASPEGRDLSAAGRVASVSGRAVAFALAGNAIPDFRRLLSDAALAGFADEGAGNPSLDPGNIAVASSYSLTVAQQGPRTRDGSESPGIPSVEADRGAPRRPLPERPIATRPPGPPLRAGRPSSHLLGSYQTRNARNQEATIGLLSTPVVVLLGVAMFLFGRRRQHEQCTEFAPLAAGRLSPMEPEAAGKSDGT